MVRRAQLIEAPDSEALGRLSAECRFVIEPKRSTTSGHGDEEVVERPGTPLRTASTANRPFTGSYRRKPMLSQHYAPRRTRSLVPQLIE